MTTRTVREVVQEYPEAARLFERLGIDYCCGGNKSLEEACAVANLSIDQVLYSIEMAEETARAKQTGRNWQTSPLADLIAHITGTHHKYTREEIARLTPLMEKVRSVHGASHPELQQVQAVFQHLAQELTMHMMKEEAILFPYIVRLEEAVIQNETVIPPPFGTVQNPVRMMEHEHDSAGAALRAIRQATADFTPPGDACISYETLYSALAAFEADLHLHIHLENNILFPRAIEIEGKQ